MDAVTNGLKNRMDFRMRALPVLVILHVLTLAAWPARETAADTGSDQLLIAAGDAAALEACITQHSEELRPVDFQRALSALLRQERFTDMLLLSTAALSWLHGRPQQEEHRTFYLYKFNHSRGVALLRLGRTDEAVAALLAAAGYSPVSELGIAVFPYERDLGDAYIAAGEYQKALQILAPIYALTQAPDLADSFTTAYEKSGHDPATTGRYLLTTRKEHSVRMTGVELMNDDGTPVRVDALRGKVTIVLSWFIGCPACHAEVPFLQKLLKTYGEDGLRVIAVETLGAGSKAVAYHRKHFSIASFPFLSDPMGRNGALATQYGANGNHTWLLNDAGEIVYSQSGWSRTLEPILETRVREELGREVRGAPRTEPAAAGTGTHESWHQAPVHLED